ncbi:hypothetical protein [Halosolutus gelatinilyticus]|uniref:hypothetical protein n=1 Tax=Halosolutus gelatinilyticus TaxID=2931975 RepID=UPI001FF1DAC3|nr:hypothetical protein [Halosolutus gelatinilyticus]
MSREEGTAPSSGTEVRGVWDRLVGPDATRSENGLVLGYSALVCGGLVLYVHDAKLSWTPLQQLVAVLIAFDIAGGIIANTTESGSRWWHRPSRTRADHLRFVAAHVHPFVLAALFAAFTFAEATLVYGVVLVGAIVILAVPERLRRPVAMGIVSVGLLVALSFVAAPAGLEWFAPFLLLKLLPGHLVRGPESPQACAR